MKHIRNSVKGVFFLEHQGVPTATLTDFSETIKDGSLCVDRNNHDLYILKSGVWTLFSSGISSGDFIPRAGTNVGLPVTGNIEIQDGVSIERGSNQITFTNDALIFHFSDNDGNPADDCAVTMDRNIIFQLDSTIISVDSNSKGNFVYKAKDNFQLFESNDNTIFTKAEDLYLTDVNNTTILNNVNNTNINNLENSMIEGNFDDLTIDGTAGALHTSFGDSENIFLKGSSVVSKPLYFSYTNIINGSYDIHLDGLLVYTNIRNSTNIYGKGVMGHTTLNDAHLHTYGKWTVTTNDNDGIYSLGDIRFGMNITNSNDISFVGKASNMNIEQSIYISNLGFVSGINLTQTTEALIVNSANAIDTDIIGSKNLTIVNNNNQISLTQIIDTEDLIAFSNQRIESTSSINNILINTKDITLDNSYNNFIIGDGRKDDGITRNGFTGSVGSNNALFGLDSTSTAVYTVGDYNFSFGDIKSDTNQDLKSGNILLGNNTINSTLTDNNIIISGKRSANINHDNRGNNVFLNVGDFNVPDVDTLYVPCKFYAVVSANVFGTFDACNISSTQTWTFPDKSGTVALLSDITNSTSGENNITGIQWIENITTVSSNPVSGTFGIGYTAEGGVTSKLIIPTTASENDQIGASCDDSSSLIIELSDGSPYTNLQKNQSIIIRYDVSKSEWLIVSSHLPMEETDGFAAFYVNETAPNGGDGSITTPFNTIEDARDAVIGTGTLTSPENQNASIFVLSGVFNISSGNFYIQNCAYDFSDGVIINYNNAGNFMFDDSVDNAVGTGQLTFNIVGNLTWNTTSSSGFFKNTPSTSNSTSDGKFTNVDIKKLSTTVDEPTTPLINLGDATKATHIATGMFNFTCSDRVSLSGGSVDGTFLIADNFSTFNFSDFRIVSSFNGHVALSRQIQLDGVYLGEFNNIEFAGGSIKRYIGIKGSCYKILFDRCSFGTSVAITEGVIDIHDDYVYSNKGYVQGQSINSGIVIKNSENTGTNASALILKNATGNLVYVDFINNTFTVDYDQTNTDFGYYNVATLVSDATRQNYFNKRLVYNNLPTALPTRTGAIWSDGGTLKIV